MKRRVICLLLVLFLPSLANAANNIEVNCPDKTGEIECDVIAHADYRLSAIEYFYELNDATFISFTIDDNWQGEGTASPLKIYTDNFKKGEFKIGVLRLNVKKNSKKIVKNKKIIYYDSNYLPEPVYNINRYNRIIIIVPIALLGIGVISFILIKRKRSGNHGQF